MKKKRLALLLSAAVLTSAPLFAMEPSGALEDEFENKSIMPICSSCHPFNVEHIEEEGKGNLNKLSNEIIFNIMSDSPTVIAMSAVSKTMYNLCLDPSLW